MVEGTYNGDNYTSELSREDEVTYKAKVSVKAELVSGKYSERLKEVGRKAQLKGFRAGKAPQHLVEKLYGDRVRYEIADKLLQDSLFDLIKVKDLAVVAPPEVDFDLFEMGKDFEYTAKISIFPEPDIKGYEAFEVSVKQQLVSDDEINRQKQLLLESKADQKTAEHEQVLASDIVVGELKAQNVEDSEEAQFEHLRTNLNDTSLPDEFVKHIIGMKIGEERELEVKLADDFKIQKLAGKTVKYTFRLSEILEQILPEFSEDFIKSLGDESIQTPAQWESELRQTLEKNAKHEEKQQIFQKILEKILEDNLFLVPQALVDDEIRSMLVRYGVVNPKNSEVNKINVAPFREGLGKDCEKRVKTSIIVDRIASQEKIEVEDADVDKKVVEIIENTGLPEERIREFLSQGQQLDSVKLDIRRDKVLDFLVARAKVTYQAA